MSRKIVPTMDEMIASCKKKQLPNEEIVFAIGSGRIVPKLGYVKKMKEALEFIKSLDGFCGVYPVDLWHTLLIFRTLNDAKRGMNLMKEKGIPLGQIVPMLIDKMYLGGANGK